MDKQHTDKKVLFNFWCNTDADIKLAIEQLESIDEDHDFVILQREDGALRIAKSSEAIAPYFEGPSGTFSKAEEVFYHLAKHIPGQLGTYVEIKINNGLLEKNMLSRAYARHRKNGASFSQANLGPFYTDCYLLFIEHDELSINVINKHPLLVGPSREDVLFYYREQEESHFKSPKNVSFDLTPKCNKHCPKCFHNTLRSQGVIGDQDMDFDLAVSLLEQCARMDPKPTIHPFVCGEPFVYPHLKEFLEKASELGLLVSLTTNGQLMTEERMNMLLDNSCIQYICISLDSLDPERYKQLQPPGPLSVVLKRIHGLFDKIDASGRDIKKQLTFVCDERNADEFDAFKEYWMQYADTVVRSMRCDFETDNAPYQYINNDLCDELPCTILYTAIRILSDGKVSMPCAVDYKGDPDLNATTMSLQDIWDSAKVKKWRRLLLDGSDPAVKDFCKNCSGCGRYFGKYEHEDGTHHLFAQVLETYTHLA